MRVFNTGFILILAIHVGQSHATWNPGELPHSHHYNLESLKDPQLLDLEQRVFEHVKNSWCSVDKADLIMKVITLAKPRFAVEIGAFTGSSTLPMLAALRHVGTGEAYIIDAWSNEEAVRGWPTDDPNTVWWNSLAMGDMQAHFAHLMNHWSFSGYKVLKMTSQEAVAHLPNIDFLHIDGNISEAGALQDSQLYVPKVTPGGYILLSNALVTIGGKATKMKALWPLFENCDIVAELDHGNTLLFQKHLKLTE